MLLLLARGCRTRIQLPPPRATLGKRKGRGKMKERKRKMKRKLRALTTKRNVKRKPKHV